MSLQEGILPNSEIIVEMPPFPKRFLFRNGTITGSSTTSQARVSSCCEKQTRMRQAEWP